MFCSNCGNQVSDNAKFCNACGAPLQKVSAPAPAPNPTTEVDEFGVPVAPKAPKAPKQTVEVDEFGVPVAPKTPKAPKQTAEVDEFGVPVAPKTPKAPKQTVEVDEFGVPVAPKVNNADPVNIQTAAPAPQTDEFGVPVYAGGGSQAVAKPVNKKLLIGIVAAVAVVALIIVLIIVLGGGGNGGAGGKSTKEAVIEASLKAMCSDPGDLMDLMPSEMLEISGEGLSKEEMREQLRESFDEYTGYKYESFEIINEMSQSMMLEQMNQMLGSSYDDYCVAQCRAVLSYDGESEEITFTFHIIKDGGKWMLMFFED